MTIHAYNEYSKGNELHNRLGGSGITARLLTIVYSNDSTFTVHGMVEALLLFKSSTDLKKCLEFPAELFCTLLLSFWSWDITVLPSCLYLD